MKEKIILRKQAKVLEPIIRIGKNGLNEGTLKEIDKMLEKRKLIKIKMLGSYFEDKDKKELIEEIVQKTQSQLIDSVGNVIVLHRK